MAKKRTLERAIAGFLVVTMVLTMLPVVGAPALAAPTELFFSEYIEGSSYNKALEIYNGTGVMVDLSAYSIELYSNGAASPSQTTALSGTLADGDVFVIAHGSADPAILAVADATDSLVVNFNGDDAVVLRKGTDIIDAIGQIGVDPGYYWGSGDVTTQNHTLRRMDTIEAGDTNGLDAFDPALEWDGYSEDTFDGLGSHSLGDEPDADGDGIPDSVDNCPDTYNPDQEDGDGDGIGDACDACPADPANDADGDGVCGDVDNCPYTYNPGQEDTDGDGIGDACEVVEASPPVINEFSASTTGTDVEWVEIYGDPNTDYSAYRMLEIEGDFYLAATGTVDEVIDLGTTDANGLYLASLPANALENGTITLLLVKDFTGAAGDDLDMNEDGVLDATPWSEVVDAVAVNDGGGSDLTYGKPVLTAYYDGLAYAPGGASRIPDGYDTDAATDWVRNDFDLAGISGFDGTPIVGEAYNTPGAPNAVVVVETAEPVINEFSASTTGTDVEWVEIYGDPNTDYSAYKVLEIEGDFYLAATGTVDEVISLGTTDANGLYLASLPANALENGTITLLLVKDFTGAAGNDLDTNEDGVLDVTPWSAIVDAVAVNDGGTTDLTYGVPVLTAYYDGLAYAPGGASRIPDGYDTEAATDWVRNDFDLAGIPGFTGSITLGEAYNTPGAPNEIYEPPPEACGDPYTPIYDVQGSGLTSPLAGTEVAVEGIVVGDFQNNASLDDGNLNGFHIQDPTGDGNPLTSDGVFVYGSISEDVAVGDRVRVRGTVFEYYGLTRINVSQVWPPCSTGNALPPATPLALPVTSLDAFEPYEGMLVTFPQALVISEYFNFDRYGEIVLTADRQDTPTAVVEPGDDAIAMAAEDLLGRVTLDDGRTASNPDPAIHPNGDIFDMDNLFRGGDTVTNVTGVLDYSYSLYRIQPTEGADYLNANPRTAAPEDVGGNLQVASFNVLNYFTTIDTGALICGPSQDMECRGADTPEEFARQRAKIIAALSAMDADVVGLIEIENNVTDYPTEDLVSGLNAVMGAGTYHYIATGPIGTDAIRQAFIYKPAAVTPVGAYAILDSTVDARFLDDYNRPVLAQTFMDNVTGGIFTLAVNHLKSKGSDCNAIGDPDTGDGAGNCNLTRLAAAEALVDWLATDPTGSGDADYLIIGDLNSYDMEDPIDAIKAGPDDALDTADDYTDLILAYQGKQAYSYVFDGKIGYLDHALAGAGLVGEVTGTTVWHINADEPDLIDYDMSFKLDAQDALWAPDAYRSSDHDPVIVGLNVCDEIAPTAEVTLSRDTLWPPNHQYVTVKAWVDAADNFDRHLTVTLVSVESNQPDEGLGDGDMPDDIVILSDYTFKLRAERMGGDEDRVYTITYAVIDDCGNVTYASATVTVPHDLR